MCSTASARATRSPFFDASLSWSIITARLGRRDGVTLLRRRRCDALRATRVCLSFHPHIVLLAMVGRHRLDNDLPADRGAQPLEGITALRLEIVRGVRMHSNQDLLAGSFLRARP